MMGITLVIVGGLVLVTALICGTILAYPLVLELARKWRNESKLNKYD